MSENRRWAFGTPANRAYLDPVGQFAAPGRPASAAQVAALLQLPLNFDSVQGHP